MKNFTRFTGIDWSGAKSPVLTKSIAVASVTQGTGAPVLEGTTWSRDLVFRWLCDLARENTRTLVGIDCNFGYSEHIGEQQFGPDYTAADLWRAVEDANTREPNYFAGGYWTHPDHARHFWVSGTMVPGFPMPRRATETACGAGNLGWPESPFKLIGPKQVGKGGLSGMRLIRALKQELGPRLAIWPFEADTNKATLVITEIYPRLFLKLTGHGNAKIRDLPALNKSLKALKTDPMPDTGVFSDHQADALISAAGLRMLCGAAKTIPESISCLDVPRKTLEREGWIFGVRP